MLLYFIGDCGPVTFFKEGMLPVYYIQLPEPNKDLWLFDCGEGPQHQMLGLLPF